MELLLFQKRDTITKVKLDNMKGLFFYLLVLFCGFVSESQGQYLFPLDAKKKLKESTERYVSFIQDNTSGHFSYEVQEVVNGVDRPPLKSDMYYTPEGFVLENEYTTMLMTDSLFVLCLHEVKEIYVTETNPSTDTLGFMNKLLVFSDSILDLTSEIRYNEAEDLSYSIVISPENYYVFDNLKSQEVIYNSFQDPFPYEIVRYYAGEDAKIEIYKDLSFDTEIPSAYKEDHLWEMFFTAAGATKTYTDYSIIYN